MSWQTNDNKNEFLKPPPFSLQKMKATVSLVFTLVLVLLGLHETQAENNSLFISNNMKIEKGSPSDCGYMHKGHLQDKRGGKVLSIWNDLRVLSNVLSNTKKVPSRYERAPPMWKFRYENFIRDKFSKISEAQIRRLLYRFGWYRKRKKYFVWWYLLLFQ